MTRRTSLLAALLAVGVGVSGLAGCAPGADGGSGGIGPARIDVDTPELRAAKEAAGVEACEPGDAEPTPDGLPEVTLPCLGGGEAIDLSRLQGPLLVNLWANWCAPCREEMPALQQFHETYGDQVAVLGVNYNETDPAGALDLVAETGVTYPLVADVDQVLRPMAPFAPLRGLPMTVLVDADGEVVYAEGVAFDTYDEVVDLVADHLPLAPVAPAAPGASPTSEVTG